MMEVDITGNWRQGAHHRPHIQVHEPPLAEGRAAFFEQELAGIAPDAALRLEYRPSLDRAGGQAIAGRWDDFGGLAVDGQQVALRWERDAGDDDRYLATCPLEPLGARGATSLRFVWHSTRPPRTTLLVRATDRASSRFRALSPDRGGELLLAHGLPFLARGIRYARATYGAQPPWRDDGSLHPWDGEPLDAGGVRVDRIHFLGMIHQFDKGNGSWYTPKGDHGWSHFVGDQAGEIVLTWADGRRTAIPLVFGFNLWYSCPWDIMWHYDLISEVPVPNYDADLFGGREEDRRSIRDGLALVDGIRPAGAQSCNARYIFTVDLGGRALRGVAFRGAPELHLHPLIAAVTAEVRDPEAGLQPLPVLTREPTHTRPVGLAEIEQRAFRPAVERIMRAFYNFKKNIPVLQAPEIPSGYVGPGYDFGPVPEAVYAETFLYHNGPGCASHIADSGMTPESPVSPGALAHYQLGCGVWRTTTPYFGSLKNWFARYRDTPPGRLGGRGSAWSRGIGELLREAMALGYGKFVDSYIDWLDTCLFAEANPPHWNRVPGQPDYCTYRLPVGEVEERGVRENDGHGICMWGRYMVYHWLGRPREWNERRFAATAASVEWLQWQLDTDLLRPGARKDVLYTESECAHHGYDIYSSYNCLHGIKLAVRMAGQLGRQDLVARWGALHRRLRLGILDHLVDRTEEGPVWHTEPDCDWQDHAHKLVHLHLATEGDSYTPLQDYAQGDPIEEQYLAISRNSYRHLMRDKNYDCLRMYGYGQGMMAQAALLLDEMGDAARFLGELVRHSYVRQLAGWACPEGIIVHRGGAYYLPVNGYMGQDSHVADATKALRLTLGVDDNDPDHLRLIPRFPRDWERAAIDRFPVLTGERRQLLAYEYERRDDRQRFACRFERDPGAWSLRLGPLPAGRRALEARLNGQPVGVRQIQSGDSSWAWLEVAAGQGHRVEIELALG